MPPAVSFSKLRIPSRWRSQPWPSSGHPHRRRVTWARSPRETLSRMTGALARKDVSRRARAGSSGCDGSASGWIRAWRSSQKCTSSGRRRTETAVAHGPARLGAAVVERGLDAGGPEGGEARGRDRLAGDGDPGSGEVESGGERRLGETGHRARESVQVRRAATTARLDHPPSDREGIDERHDLGTREAHRRRRARRAGGRRGSSDSGDEGRAPAGFTWTSHRATGSPNEPNRRTTGAEPVETPQTPFTQSRPPWASRASRVLAA